MKPVHALALVVAAMFAIGGLWELGAILFVHHP